MENEGSDDDESFKQVEPLHKDLPLKVNKSQNSSKVIIPDHRSWIQLWLHAALMCGRDFLYAVEVVLVTPIMLQLGMSESMYSYIWFCSPTIGLLLGPIMGNWSDRCTARWGRRRPFILGFVVGTVIALTLMIFSRDLALAITDSEVDQRTLGLVFGVLGTQTMDFCLDQLETPLRAFTLDVCSPFDQQRAFLIQTLFMGFGGALGFIIDGIKWEEIFKYEAVGFQIKVVYIFALVIYLGTATMTLLSIKEAQWNKRSCNKRSSSFKGSTKMEVTRAVKSESNITSKKRNLVLSNGAHRSPCKVSVPAVTVTAECCKNEENEEEIHHIEEDRNMGFIMPSPAIRSITILPRVSLCKSVFMTMSCPEGLNDVSSSATTSSSLVTDDDSSSDEDDSAKYEQSHNDEDHYGSSMPNLPMQRHPATFLEILKNKMYTFSSSTSNIANDGSNVDPKIFLNNAENSEKNCHLQNFGDKKDVFINDIDKDFQYSSNCKLDSNGNSLGAVRSLHFEPEDGTKEALIVSKKEKRKKRKGRKKAASEDDAKPVSFRMLWLSIITMPMKLRFLCLSLLSSFIGIEVLLLWYTNIFGSVVYGGDPTAPANSTELKLYNDGVHMGCWGLTMYAVSMMLFSVLLEYFNILSKFSLRIVYAGGQIVTAISAAIMFLCPNKLVILLLSWTIGITVSTSLTIPYILVGKYHQEEEYVMKSPGGTRRGYGTDCAILACQMYAGNLLYAALSGPIIAYYGGVRIMMLVASICHAVAFFICVVLVTYPGEKNFHCRKKRRTEEVATPSI